MHRSFTILLVAWSVLGLIDKVPAGLVSYLPFDNTLANSVDSGYDGSFGSWNAIPGPPEDPFALVETAGTDPTFAAGRFGGAVQFAGSTSGNYSGPATAAGNYVSVPAGGGLNGTANVSVSMWVKWNGTQPMCMAGDSNTGNQFGCVLARRQVSGFYDPMIGLNGDDPATCNGLRFGLSAWMYGENTLDDMWDGWAMPQAPNNVHPGDGVWANVVTTFNNATVTMYMNGVLLRSIEFSHPLSNDASVPLTIGAYYGPDYEYGPSNSTIDDVGVFDRTLSDGEAEAIFNTPALAALSNYDLGKMNQLFALNGTASVQIGNLTWSRITGLTGHAAGDAWMADGRYFVQLTDDGIGVATMIALMPGDANRDGTVDVADLNRVLTNYNKTSIMSWADGDFDGDGIVTVADLNKVLTNYNRSIGASVSITAVPEPSIIGLLLAGAAVGLLVYVWQRRA